MHSADRGVRTTRQRGCDTHAQQAMLTRGIVQTGCNCRPYCKELASVSVEASTYTHTHNTHTAQPGTPDKNIVMRLPAAHIAHRAPCSSC